MAGHKFKKGDVVGLKSGGPDMTVTRVEYHELTGAPHVWCVWFAGKTKHDDVFDPEVLEARRRPRSAIIAG